MTGWKLGILLGVVTSVACVARDRTITRGADGELEWSRRLGTAVPLGIAAESARAVMLRNGFHCENGVDSAAYIWCEKFSDKPLVKRRWQAVIRINSQHLVNEVRATTGLIGL